MLKYLKKVDEVRLVIWLTSILLLLTPIFVTLANIQRGVATPGGGEALIWMLPGLIYALKESRI